MKLGKTLRDLYGELASAVGSSRKQAGSWFVAFSRTVLADYAQQVLELGGATNFRQKWPHLDDDQIADRIVQGAVWQSATAGAATGVTSTAAYLATLGAHVGMAALPAAVSTLGAEILYTTRVQLRLVYDLATLYGYPVDPDDPEDLYRAFALAHGVKVSLADVDRDATTLDAIRAHLRALTKGQARDQARLALNVIGPQIGRQIALRALVRAGVPFVGVGASAAWNAFSTWNLAIVARQELMALAELRGAGVALGEAIGDDPDALRLAVEAAVCVASADGRYGMREREVIDTMVHAAGCEPSRLGGLEDVALDRADVTARLARVKDADARATIAACLQLVAVCDGVLTNAEDGLLDVLLRALREPWDPVKARERAVAFQRRLSPAQRAELWMKSRLSALPSPAEAGRWVSEQASEAGRWVSARLPQRRFAV